MEGKIRSSFSKVLNREMTYKTFGKRGGRAAEFTGRPSSSCLTANLHVPPHLLRSGHDSYAFWPAPLCRITPNTTRRPAGFSLASL